MPFKSYAVIALAAIALSGCSKTPKRQARAIPAGEKAIVGQLRYSIVDTQVVTRLGDDPVTPRYPKNRFYLVQILIANTANEQLSVPGTALVDDTRKIYPELGDGSGVSHWLGVRRPVGPGDSIQGTLIFDAPVGHMRLKVTEDSDEADVYLDIPVTVVHELETPPLPAPPPSATDAPTLAPAPKAK